MFLEAAVIVLALLWAGTLAFLLRYVRQQRELFLQQAERDAVRDRRILELVKRVDHYQQSAVRVGDEVHELRAILAPLPDKLAQIEQRDPSSLSCGLTQAEAQLMSKLHKS
ncbi:hypothetical protein PS683_00811 [Pseudomonas fluorescens]|uniref:DUF2802 domain-containing protein n=1 Tax=Pseudomonas fluorescens TaxID=294 RepID=A0A5E6Q8Z9_PSEFL|nr:hypothetical protein PS683_00811 [Pseudomonas fluorescens]VVM51707.1 hypothetical protein PS683_00811 [Pseudomonas fluorescens]